MSRNSTGRMLRRTYGRKDIMAFGVLAGRKCHIKISYHYVVYVFLLRCPMCLRFFVQHSFIWKALRKFKAPKLFFTKKRYVRISSFLLNSSAQINEIKSAKSNLLCAKFFHNFFFPLQKGHPCAPDSGEPPMITFQSQFGSHPVRMVPVNDENPSSAKGRTGRL